jgi:hypothetical protein
LYVFFLAAAAFDAATQRFVFLRRVILVGWVAQVMHLFVECAEESVIDVVEQEFIAIFL